MSRMSDKVAVVTGANKNFGFEIVKGLCQRFDGVVYLTTHDEAEGTEAVAELNKLGLRAEYHQLDVGETESMKAFRDHINEKHGGLDILINNAVVTNHVQATNLYEETKNLINLNYRSIVLMNELIYPFVKHNVGRILNISSDCGHFRHIIGKYWIDHLSKKNRPLNFNAIKEFVDWYSGYVENHNETFNHFPLADVEAKYKTNVVFTSITMIQQKEFASRNIVFNSLHPGLIYNDEAASDIGFYNPDDAAQKLVDLVLDASNSNPLYGACHRFDKKVRDWYDYVDDYYANF